VRYREHHPAAALAPYVTCFWELAASGEPHRVLPDGAMDVLFTMGTGSARVIGPMTHAIVADMGGPTSIVGVRFRSGAAIDLLGVSSRELRDDSAAIRDVWGARGRSLDARLAGARDADAAIRIIEGELESRIAGARAPDPRVARAVATLRAAGGELPIPAVAARAGVGERQLERLFDERVGYGPKMFARVVRLQRTTHAIQRGSLASWARFAVDCGYADQAHLVREFRALTGVTPTVYATGRGMSEIDNPAS
jgi:AraC-like DNA-binding protein